MTRISATERILWNLQKRLNTNWDAYMEYDDAHLAAIRYTGLDFGDDSNKWELWFKKYPKIVGLVYSKGSLKMQCQLLLKNLQGEISPQNRKEYVALEHALALLIEKTGENFGENIKVWEEWINRNIQDK